MAQMLRGLIRTAGHFDRTSSSTLYGATSYASSRCGGFGGAQQATGTAAQVPLSGQSPQQQPCFSSFSAYGPTIGNSQSLLGSVPLSLARSFASSAMTLITSTEEGKNLWQILPHIFSSCACELSKPPGIVACSHASQNSNAQGTCPGLLMCKFVHGLISIVLLLCLQRTMASDSGCRTMSASSFRAGGWVDRSSDSATNYVCMARARTSEDVCLNSPAGRCCHDKMVTTQRQGLAF